MRRFPRNRGAVLAVVALLAGSASPSWAANEAPVVELGPDIGVLERDLGLLTFDGWAAVLLPGPSSESGQSLTVDVEVLGGTFCDENPSLSLPDCADAMFDIAPGIDPGTGTLAFATARNTDGEIRLRAVVQDDGGTSGGGVDTTTADFKITLNRAEPTRSTVVRNPWKSNCVPVQLSVDPTNYNKDDMNALSRIVTNPANGFITTFISPLYEWGYPVLPPGGVGTWMYRLIGGPTTPYGQTLCYIPFSPTFTGFDSFTYLIDDGHGGDGVLGTVEIEIFEQ